MLVPEFLYQLSQRDQQVTWLDPRCDRQDNSAAAATVASQFTVPAGRVLLLHNFCVQAIAGAAQTNSQIIVILLAPGGANVSVRVVNFAAAVQNNTDWQGQIIIPPLWSLFANAVFNAGAAANRCILDTIGVLIPVGNIARV